MYAATLLCRYFRSQNIKSRLIIMIQSKEKGSSVGSVLLVDGLHLRPFLLPSFPWFLVAIETSYVYDNISPFLINTFDILSTASSTTRNTTGHSSIHVIVIVVVIAIVVAIIIITVIVIEALREAFSCLNLLNQVHCSCCETETPHYFSGCHHPNSICTRYKHTIQ